MCELVSTYLKLAASYSQPHTHLEQQVVLRTEVDAALHTSLEVDDYVIAKALGGCSRDILLVLSDTPEHPGQTPNQLPIRPSAVAQASTKANKQNFVRKCQERVGLRTVGGAVGIASITQHAQREVVNPGVVAAFLGFRNVPVPQNLPEHGHTIFKLVGGCALDTKGILL